MPFCKFVCKTTSVRRNDVHAKLEATLRHLSPVLPLLGAADEVLRDLLDVLHVSAAVGIKQRQTGLDEGAGDLVQAAFLVVAGRLAAVQLRL